MDAQSEVSRLLKQAGAEKVREKNHEVYRLPNGMAFCLPSTPSTYKRSWENTLSQLRRMLHIRRDVVKGKNRGQVKPGSVTIPDIRRVPFSEVNTRNVKEAISERLIADNDFETLMRLQGVVPIDKERA